MSALAPAVRLLGLLILVSGLFAARLPLVALILALGLVTLFIEGMRPRALGPELLPLLFLVLFMTAIDTLSFETGPRFLPEGIPQALLDSGRLLASFVLARRSASSAGRPRARGPKRASSRTVSPRTWSRASWKR